MTTPRRLLDAHSMSPGVVLGTLAGLGGRVERVLVVGCQPATLDEGIGLSPAVAAAVDRAVELCHARRGRHLPNRPERRPAG